MALSNDEKRILAQTLLGEAGGEGLQGMMAVAHVIKNRAASGRFPNDPVSVALQPKQFSTWNSGQGGNNPGRFGPGSQGYDQAIRAVEAVFEGNAPDPTGGATHYWSPSGMRAMGYASDPYWARSEATPAGRVQIGNHVFLAQREPQTALDAVNAMGGVPTAPTPPQRPAGLAYVSPPMPPLPRTDPRAPSARIDALAGTVPAAVLPRLNDANVNERAIDTYGPDAQATSPTQDMWLEYKNWLEQSTPGTPGTRVARGAPATVPFPWNDQMGQAPAVANALGGPPVPPQRPPGLPAPVPTAVAQVPIPPARPTSLPTAPMATFAGETVGGNPVEQAGSFLGDFAANGGFLGMGLNAITGRGLFPGDQGVIPTFKREVAERTAELNGDFLGGIFSRRVGAPPSFSTAQPEGRSVRATRVGPSGLQQGYLTESRKPRVGSGNYNASVRDANMAALRGVQGNSMREKIENFQRSGGTLFKAR